MPTPFYHLHIARQLLEAPGLPLAASHLLTENLPAFLFGHVAPDVQTVSGQKREATHFYTTPLRAGAAPPWEQLLTEHPALTCRRACNPAQRAFIAGYLCHLQADWFWSAQVFEPHFGPNAGWKEFRERLYLHNALRAYLDFKALATLDANLRAALSQDSYGVGLPFVEAAPLQAWHTFLVEQLKPGAAIQTVEVFAARQGIAAETYYHLIQSEEAMQRQIFGYVPRQHFENYRVRLLEANRTLLQTYLSETNP